MLNCSISNIGSVVEYLPRFRVPLAAARHPPELRLLEPVGGHERVGRHGGLQAQEGRNQLQRAGPGWRRLVHVPAEGRRLPACPGFRVRTRPHRHPSGKAEEEAGPHACAAPRAAAVQVGQRARRG